MNSNNNSCGEQLNNIKNYEEQKRTYELQVNVWILYAGLTHWREVKRVRPPYTGYAVCPTLSVAPGTGYRYGKQDAKLALHPLPHKNARCRCKIQDTEFAPHLPIATHVQNWDTDT